MDESTQKAEIAKLYFEVAKSLKHCMRKNFEYAGITMPQTMVIGTLVENGELKISELSKKIDLSNSTISGIVDRLEKQQMVVRTRSEEDRRIVYVKVTPKVEEFHKGIHKKVEESFIDLLSEGTTDDIEKVIIGFKTLKKILNDKKE